MWEEQKLERNDEKRWRIEADGEIYNRRSGLECLPFIKKLYYFWLR
jgi:hypothetical protein